MILRIPKNKESRKFLAVFTTAAVLVLLVTIITFLPASVEETGVRVAQDTYTIISTPPASRGNQLQLKSFGLRRNPRPENSCVASRINREPDIIYATDPALGGVVTAGGQIRIWVWEDDGFGGSVAPGTRVDPSTGRITTIGDRTAADSNGYLWEPAIYLTKLTAPDQPGPYSGDRENGGTPYFPVAIKGVANYAGNRSADIQSAPVDPPVNVIKPRTGNDLTFSEFIWDVNSLGLTSGYWRTQIIMHDGDKDLAINCTTISI